ncbi:MAG TPA: neocarzinostatin apoprotein domain-containing protein [Propionibacteriaceae bacterium]|nr:neocarzinostatin apoprotein domain-containing protein [Propionibacteriaceae bacterium]
MRLLRLLVPALAAATAWTVGSVPTPGWAASAPKMTVSQVSGLSGGDTVQVSAHGLPRRAEVRVVQCDNFDSWHDINCGDMMVVTASATGSISVPVTLGDPVYGIPEVGDPVPVYCRADVCRIFLVWLDASGEVQVLSSSLLEFTGAPATILASRSDDLPARRTVTVTGTAYGAEGRTVAVFEASCFELVQESGCYGELPSRTTTVRSDGTYTLRYVVRRYLADGTDCAEADILGHCKLVAVVLDEQGNPDDSFGVSRIGQPAVWLTFRRR